MATDGDMKELFDAFREECAEGLDAMESGLLALDPGAVDLDEVGSVFRAAHSIKGGAAIFGLDELAEFTHEIETLLDQLRGGERPVSSAIIEALLAAVDCLRSMLAGTDRGSNQNHDHDHDHNHNHDREHGLVAAAGGAALLERLRATLAIPGAEAWALAQAPAASAGAAAGAHRDAGSGARRWTLRFDACPALFTDGVDVPELFDALAALGTLKVDCDPMALPSLEDLDPAVCHLAFTLTLDTTAPRDALEACIGWLGDASRPEIIDEAVPAPATAADAPDREQGVEGSGELPAETFGAATAAGDGTTPAVAVSAQSDTAGAGTIVAAREAGSIRVPIEKVDALLDLVGELIITQSMLRRCGEGDAPERVDELRDGLDALERYTRELQERAMGIRMLPIQVGFSRIPRLVHDLCARLGKEVDVAFAGESTELDKHVLEKMSDPLVHLVRNALDHGIETPEARRRAGKPARGSLHLSAAHEHGSILIRIADDGAGLDRPRILARAIERGLLPAGAQPSPAEIDALIFAPGFSTSDSISDISGRGVGMDVVHTNIEALGGRLQIESEPGRGTTLSIYLPLTLAILEGQLVRVGEDVFVFPLLSIVETLQVAENDVRDVLRAGSVYRMRDRWIPVVRLRDLFELPAPREALRDELLVVVESGGQAVGFFVDDLREQQQVVIKSLEKNYRRTQGLAGATILGDGRVALILDCAALVRARSADASGHEDVAA